MSELHLDTHEEFRQKLLFGEIDDEDYTQVTSIYTLGDFSNSASQVYQDIVKPIEEDTKEKEYLIKIKSFKRLCNEAQTLASHLLQQNKNLQTLNNPQIEAICAALGSTMSSFIGLPNDIKIVCENICQFTYYQLTKDAFVSHVDYILSPKNITPEAVEYIAKNLVEYTNISIDLLVSFSTFEKHPHDKIIQVTKIYDNLKALFQLVEENESEIAYEAMDNFTLVTKLYEVFES